MDAQLSSIASLGNMPADILERIARRLSARDIVAMASTSRRMRAEMRSKLHLADFSRATRQAFAKVDAPSDQVKRWLVRHRVHDKVVGAERDQYGSYAREDRLLVAIVAMHDALACRNEAIQRKLFDVQQAGWDYMPWELKKHLQCGASHFYSFSTVDLHVCLCLSKNRELFLDIVFYLWTALEAEEPNERRDRARIWLAAFKMHGHLFGGKPSLTPGALVGTALGGYNGNVYMEGLLGIISASQRSESIYEHVVDLNRSGCSYFQSRAFMDKARLGWYNPGGSDDRLLREAFGVGDVQRGYSRWGSVYSLLPWDESEAAMGREYLADPETRAMFVGVFGADKTMWAWAPFQRADTCRLVECFFKRGPGRGTYETIEALVELWPEWMLDWKVAGCYIGAEDKNKCVPIFAMIDNAYLRRRAK